MTDNTKYEIGDLILVQEQGVIIPVIIIRLEYKGPDVRFNGRSLSKLTNIEYSETIFDWTTSLKESRKLKNKILSHNLPVTVMVYNYLAFSLEQVIGLTSYSGMYKPVLLSNLNYI